MPHSARLNTRGSGTALFGGLVVAVLCIVGVLIHGLAVSRTVDWQRALDAARSLARALESEIAGNVMVVDSTLQGVLQKLENPEVMKLPAGLRDLMLFDRSANAQNLQAILVTDKDGKLVYSSRPDDTSSTSRGDRDYFQYHRNNETSAPYIGKPIVSRTSGLEIVTISRRINDASGRFAGIVVGALELNYFTRLFEATSLGEGSSITLARTDGIVLTRWPFSQAIVGRDTSGAALFKYLAERKVGEFESDTLIDGTRRLIAYRQIKDFPLVVGIGQSTAQIYRQWIWDAATWSVIVAMLCAMVLALATLLFRELNLKTRAARRFSLLAEKDDLTGLENRRSFTRAARREWARAVRAGESISVALIDVDHFKSINDRLGHQYGDEVLRRIAMAVTDCLQRSTDMAARIGGDEFVLLLPSTSAAGAVEVCEKIRDSLAVICGSGEVVAPHLSIGIASTMAIRDHSFAELLKAADVALYAAKARGRNQTAIAPVDVGEAVAPSLGLLEAQLDRPSRVQ